jgi:hypothetical protein
MSLNYIKELLTDKTENSLTNLPNGTVKLNFVGFITQIKQLKDLKSKHLNVILEETFLKWMR